jgi:hypothetical protein
MVTLLAGLVRLTLWKMRDSKFSILLKSFNGKDGKEEVVFYRKVLYRHLVWGTEKNNEESPSGYPVYIKT